MPCRFALFPCLAGCRLALFKCLAGLLRISDRHVIINTSQYEHVKSLLLVIPCKDSRCKTARACTSRLPACLAGLPCRLPVCLSWKNRQNNTAIDKIAQCYSQKRHHAIVFSVFTFLVDFASISPSFHPKKFQKK